MIPEPETQRGEGGRKGEEIGRGDREKERRLKVCIAMTYKVVCSQYQESGSCENWKT